MSGPIWLEGAAVLATSPAPAIAIAVPGPHAALGWPVTLTVWVDNSAEDAAEGTAVSLVPVGAEAAGQRVVAPGSIRSFTLQWPQPPGSPFSAGIGLYAASETSCPVALDVE
jgi:hypothetical protein